MARQPNSPWFISALVLAAVLFVGEAFWVYRSWQAMGKAEVQVKLKQRELTALERLDPPPTETEAAGIAQQVDGLETSYEDLRSKLKGARVTKFLPEEAVPKARTDAYIDLAAYVEKLQALAQKHGVKVAAEERFGFKTYVNEGPEADLIPVVFRQRQVLQYLLQTLFTAKPRALNGVRRATPAEVRSSQNARDGFTLYPALSLSRPGYVDTLAFQIEFEGETAVLRQWLTTLAKYEIPVVVRAIEVEETDTRAEMKSNPRNQDTAGIVIGNTAPVTLVTSAPSKFTVTLEYLQLVERQPGGEE
jgi:hypothetical protein